MSIGKSKQPSNAKKPTRTAPVGRWHAVSIEVHPGCCSAARAYRNARFLSAQAPMLPLPACPMAEACRCFYKHYADRRAQLRRREEITGLRSNVRVTEERRVERDRREMDGW